jgi:hypothetical protein
MSKVVNKDKHYLYFIRYTVNFKESIDRSVYN